MAVGTIGDATSGGHQATMTALLDILNSEELPQLVPSAEASSFGPDAGLARDSHCLSAVPTSPSPLRRQRPVADNLLRNLESTRPGTDIFFHKMIGHSLID